MKGRLRAPFLCAQMEGFLRMWALFACVEREEILRCGTVLLQGTLPPPRTVRHRSFS